MRQIWQEVGQENASIAYVDRGKKDAADVLIVIGKARDVLEQAIKNVRSGENTRTQTANRSTTSDTTTIANPNAEVKDNVDPRETSASRRTRTASTPTCPGTSHAPPSVDGDRRNIAASSPSTDPTYEKPIASHTTRTQVDKPISSLTMRRLMFVITSLITHVQGSYLQLNGRFAI